LNFKKSLKGIEMTKEEFQKEVTDAVVGVVTPLREEIGKSIESLQLQVDARVKELTETVTAPRIEMHENFDDDLKGGFKCLTQLCQQVWKAEKNPRAEMPAELKKWTSHVEARQKAAGSGLQEGDNEYGGVLIPPEYKNDLLLAIQHKNIAMGLCTPVPMGSNIVEIPFVNGFDESGGLVWGGIQWLWTDELGQYSETRPKLGRIQMKLKKLIGLAYASEEVLQDSPQSMEGILRQCFASGLNVQLSKVLLRGTGVGQPMGILNAPCKVAQAAETGQAAGTIVYENVLKMFARISDMANCVWMANPDCLPQLATMSLAVGTGVIAVFMPAGGASGKPYDTLFGRQIIWSDQCSTCGTEGDIVLGDWSQYLLGTKGGAESGVRMDSSIHLKFDFAQVAFRWSMRLDGQPWWATYYTPPNSSVTRSPFVTLATRS